MKCCSDESKLGDTSRHAAIGCHILYVTEDDAILSHSTRKQVVDEAKAIHSSNIMKETPVLIWASVPCAGGTAWFHINLKNESAKKKVKNCRSIHRRMWSAFVDLVNHGFCQMSGPGIVRMDKFVIRVNMIPVKIDGCAVGIKNSEGVRTPGLLRPIRTVFATTFGTQRF